MLADRYDAVLFDLDGVIYLGPDPVPGVPDAVRQLARHGTRLGYVTNNAARPPTVVADQLRGFGIDCGPDDVVTSAQAGARVLADRYGSGAPVLVVGAPGLWEAVAEVGLTPVRTAEERPVAVIQGFDPELSWPTIAEGALAIRAGADWLATNTDPTRPTERGLEPGNGAAVAAIGVAVEAEPEVAGKPHLPLMQETVRRMRAEQPIFVGDRLDTDIAGAGNLGIASMLVLTGAHGPAHLFAAAGVERPTHLGRSVADLLQPAREVRCEHGRVRVGAVEAYADDDHGPDTLELGHDPAPEQLVDAIWAAALLSWSHADQGRNLDTRAVAAALTDRLTD